jgi:hypothetical protein
LSDKDFDEVELRDVILKTPEERNSDSYIMWCKKIHDTAVPLMGKILDLTNEVKLYSRYLKVKTNFIEIYIKFRSSKSRVFVSLWSFLPLTYFVSFRSYH